MAGSEKFRLLIKNDRRKQWKLLKTKHKAAIAKAKLDFDLKFGSALDKHQANVEKLTALSAKRELRDADVQPVINSALALEKIVIAYQPKVKLLADPAKKELSAFLKSLDADREGWVQLVYALQSQRPTAPNDAERRAAAALIIPLDNVRSLCLQLVTRGERATLAYQTQVPNPRPAAAALASRITEAARLAGPNAHETANAANQAAGGSNYALFKQRAKAVAPVLTRLRNAMQKFKTQWDMTLDDHTVSANIDAIALKGNYEQVISDCDGALALIKTLP